MRKITLWVEPIVILLTIHLSTINSLQAQNFTRITSTPVVSDVAGFLGVAWGDYNNDGNIDLFIANYQRPNFLFQNNGD